MNRFFIVKGELAAWALGLDQDETLAADEIAMLEQKAPPPEPRRRWRRWAHESYRHPSLCRREAAR